MKKSRFYYIFCFFSLFLFIYFASSLFLGCKPKSVDKEKYGEEAVAKINEFFFQSTYDALMGKGNFYVPDSLKIFFKRPVLVDGVFYSVFEVVFPNRLDAYGLEDFSQVYDCHSDDGKWVDGVLFSLEEERIGAELQKMEEVISSGLYAPNEEGEADAAEEKVSEITVMESRVFDETLGFMEFGKEIFIPQKNGDSWIFINAFEDKITRSFYDNLFRCYCEEKWIIDNNGVEELKKIVKTEFFENSYKPSSKIFVYPLISEKKQCFNEKGLLIKEDNYNLIDDNKVIQSTLELKYNNNDKIKESNVLEYVYDGENKEKLSYIFNKKYLYKYNGNDIPPDFDYYEDGKLKIRNLYESANTYTSEVFFDEGFHVKTFYKDGKLIKEVFVTNDNNERIKNYE